MANLNNTNTYNHQQDGINLLFNLLKYLSGLFQWHLLDKLTLAYFIVDFFKIAFKVGINRFVFVWIYMDKNLATFGLF